MALISETTVRAADSNGFAVSREAAGLALTLGALLAIAFVFINVLPFVSASDLFRNAMHHSAHIGQ